MGNSGSTSITRRNSQLVHHVALEIFGQGAAFDELVDQRRLGLEDRLDEFVDRVAADHVGDVDGLLLPDAVGPVFGLPVIDRHPVEIVEDHLPRRREVEPDAPGSNLRGQYLHGVVLLKAVG